jgi:type II secretory pathway component GspD/PulD (secretin)
MKNRTGRSGRPRTYQVKNAIFGFLVIGFFLLISPALVHGEGFSLQASHRPLKSVLNELSRMSGITFIYDDDWADFPVSVQLKNIELEQALKRILANLNHAIIFNPDGSISIRIYEVVNRNREPEVGSGNHSSILSEMPEHRADDPRLQEETDDTATDERLSQEVEETEEAAGEESEPEAEESLKHEEAPADDAEAPPED